MRRRNLLGLIPAGIGAGCLGTAEQDDDECDLEHGEWEGQADPIDVSIEAEREDRVQRQCASEAAQAALDELDDRHDIDLADEQWISAVGGRDAGTYWARVKVREIRNHEGGLLTCPDPGFDVTEAPEKLPEEVTLTLHFEDDESFECSHRIDLEAITLHDD